MRISVIYGTLSVSCKRVVSVLSPLASNSCGGSHISRINWCFFLLWLSVQRSFFLFYSLNKNVKESDFEIQPLQIFLCCICLVRVLNHTSFPLIYVWLNPSRLVKHLTSLWTVHSPLRVHKCWCSNFFFSLWSEFWRGSYYEGVQLPILTPRDSHPVCFPLSPASLHEVLRLKALV